MLRGDNCQVLVLANAELSKERLSRLKLLMNNILDPPRLLVGRNTPIVCPQISGWVIATLAAACIEWVFTSKSNLDSKYQTDPEYINDRARKALAASAPIWHS
jgi:hypothetical protein